jgi:hypothetical protein
MPASHGSHRIPQIFAKIQLFCVVQASSEGNLLHPGAEACHRITLNTPIVSNSQLDKLVHIKEPGFLARVLPMVYAVDEGGHGLIKGLNHLLAMADQAITDGVNMVILSDRNHDQLYGAIPALVAVSALHQHLVEQGCAPQGCLDC